MSSQTSFIEHVKLFNKILYMYLPNSYFPLFLWDVGDKNWAFTIQFPTVWCIKQGCDGRKLVVPTIPCGLVSSEYKWLMTGALLASVAKLDVHSTGDQEVSGLTLAGSAIFFLGDWSWNIFYGHSLPSADSRRAVVSFSWKKVHSTGKPLRGLSLPSKREVR